MAEVGGFDNAILQPLEALFGSLGLNDPMMRGLAVAGGTAAVLFYLKPSLMFDEQTGKMRAWNVTSPDAVPLATPLPLFLAAAGTGIIAAYFA